MSQTEERARSIDSSLSDWSTRILWLLSELNNEESGGTIKDGRTKRRGIIREIPNIERSVIFLDLPRKLFLANIFDEIYRLHRREKTSKLRI